MTPTAPADDSICGRQVSRPSSHVARVRSIPSVQHAAQNCRSARPDEAICTPVVWPIVALVVVAGLAIALVAQRKHEEDLVGLLTPLLESRVDLAIANTTSKPGAIGEYTGIISDIDPVPRWVLFRWIEWRDGGNVGAPSPDRLAEIDVRAHDIRWVEAPGQARIDLV